MRKPKQSARQDPVAEIRRIRAKLWREAGGTVDGLHRLLDEREAARQDITEKNGKPASKRRKMAAKKVTGKTGAKRSSRRPKAKSKVYELAGSLRHYAVGPISSSEVRDYVRREVARAAAQEELPSSATAHLTGFRYQ